MNIQKKVEVYLDKKRNTRQIDVVQGDSSIQLVFSLMDFIAPEGTTATLYVQKPSGKFVYQETDITVKEDTVTVDLKNQAITEYGKVYYQLTLVNGADEITTFASIIQVEKSLANVGAEESKTVVSTFDELVEEEIAKIKASTQTQIAELQTESAKQQEAIEGKANTVLATIPEDYTATYNMAVEALRTKAPVIVQKASGSPILLTDSADSNLIDFTSKGRSEQKQYSGKNLWEFGDRSFTLNSGTLYTNLKAGTYTISAFITSSGTDSDKSYMYIQNDDQSSGTYAAIVALERNVRTSATFTLATDVTKLALYAETNSATSAGDTATWVDIQIEEGTVATDYEPYVGGTVSPNPTYPQTIKSVGDSGYYDGELLSGCWSGSNGAYASNNAYICSKNPIPCTEGDVIKFIYEVSTRIVSFNYYDKDMNFISTIVGNAVSEFSATAPTNAKYVHFSISYDGNVMTVADAKHICVTINGKYALIVKNEGGNLWDEQYRNGYYGDSGEFISSVSCIANLNPIRVIPNQMYGINYTSIDVRGYDKDMNYISQITLITKNDILLFTIPSDVYFINFRAGMNYGGTYNNDICLVVADSSTSEIDYVPHEEQTTYIPLTEPLRGIGKVKDEIVKVDGVWGVLRRILRKTFNGSEGWLWNDEWTYAFIMNNNIDSNIKNYSTALCSHFTYVESTVGVDYAIAIGQGTVLKNKDFTSISDWSTWLSANPIIVDYQVIEPTFEPFTDQTPFYSMKTFDGVTLISSDAEMEIEYATDTKRYIDNKIAELSAALLNN